jgi:hypothetical protein
VTTQTAAASKKTLKNTSKPARVLTVTTEPDLKTTHTSEDMQEVTRKTGGPSDPSSAVSYTESSRPHSLQIQQSITNVIPDCSSGDSASDAELTTTTTETTAATIPDSTPVGDNFKASARGRQRRCTCTYQAPTAIP